MRPGEGLRIVTGGYFFDVQVLSVDDRVTMLAADDKEALRLARLLGHGEAGGSGADDNKQPPTLLKGRAVTCGATTLRGSAVLLPAFVELKSPKEFDRLVAGSVIEIDVPDSPKSPKVRCTVVALVTRPGRPAAESSVVLQFPGKKDCGGALAHLQIRLRPVSGGHACPVGKLLRKARVQLDALHNSTLAQKPVPVRTGRAVDWKQFAPGTVIELRGDDCGRSPRFVGVSCPPYP